MNELKIFCSENSHNYGIIGMETSLCDKNNAALKVGDIVLVTHKKSPFSRLSFVCQFEDDTTAYIPYIPHIRACDSVLFEYEKVIDCSKIKNGFKLGQLEVIFNE